jgi:hypothetical protein
LDSGSLNPCIFIRPWSTGALTLDGGDYGEVQTRAPLRFNVVETPSIVDSVGLLDLLVAVVPLISPSRSAAVLLAPAEADAIGWFPSHFCGDIPTISLTFDLIPATYLSRMTTRADRGGALVSRTLNETTGQYYKLLVRKRPPVADTTVVITRHSKPLLSFDINQLARPLPDVYLEIGSSVCMPATSWSSSGSRIS